MTATINASTSAGVIVTSDTSGALALQTANTTAMTINSSQVVNFANSPTVAGSALPSGAMTLISTLTASSSASLAWTGLSGYNNYTIIVNDLGPSTNGVTILLQFYQSGAWVTSAYTWLGSFVTSGSVNPMGSSGVSGFNIISQGSGNVQTIYNNITIFVNNMNNSSYVSATWQGWNQYSSGSSGDSLTGSGFLANLYGGTGIRLIANSGNLKQGTASLYGISS